MRILLREGPLCADTRHVVGEDFAALLTAAQGGSEQAFSVLWRDANPALLRYLRVVAAEYADDVAAETWVQVVRGLGEVAPLGEECCEVLGVYRPGRRVVVCLVLAAVPQWS